MITGISAYKREKSTDTRNIINIFDEVKNEKANTKWQLADEGDS
jgi:hypothetical protein